ncbi:hypothetical protein FRC96_06940 [Lujinxingia vulgaris]|uniref:Uncharacterized protein n=1 Tax=Lujinxingia vulgaris TaxID=2600176 RepID=A0A5C6XPL2_9DELT|nr:hypothetical protein [Lujinxingia vulgaris]TXD39587.1 hypothetical protein FRC96_06940 [Lujinxingia vulgaris]
MSESPYDLMANYDYRKTEEYKRHERALARVRAMTREEKRQTLIDAGILNEAGELVERYGGTAPNPED